MPYRLYALPSGHYMSFLTWAVVSLRPHKRQAIDWIGSETKPCLTLTTSSNLPNGHECICFTSETRTVVWCHLVEVYKMVSPPSLEFRRPILLIIITISRKNISACLTSFAEHQMRSIASVKAQRILLLRHRLLTQRNLPKNQWNSGLDLFSQSLMSMKHLLELQPVCIAYILSILLLLKVPCWYWAY